MRITKIDQTLINLSATEQYAGSIDSIILQKLKDKLENKCDKCTFILKVVKIIRRSKCIQTQSRLDGSADVSVWYEVNALIYNPGDIIADAEIQNIERSNDILCKHDSSIIKVKGSRIMQKLNKGQIIPVKITQVLYTNGAPKLTVLGALYAYSFTCILYRVNISNIPQEMVELLTMTINDIQNELQLDIVKSAKFFDDIFYPFKTSFNQYKKENKDPSGYTYTNILDFTKLLLEDKIKSKKLILLNHPRIIKSIPNIYIVDPNISTTENSINHLIDPEQFTISIVSEKIENVLYNMLKEYLNYLLLLKQLCKVHSEESKKNHSNLWNIYKQLKRE